MRRGVTLASVLAVVFFCAMPARAEVGASGTRLSVAGGAPRFYMTYGHMDEPELYAPIVVELKRLDVAFRLQGDNYVVYYKGSKIAAWPVVRSRDEIPESTDEGFVLAWGGNVFVPVKRLSELAPIDLKWDRGTNMVAVVPGKPKPRKVAKTPVPWPATPARGTSPAAAAVDAAPGEVVTLTGVTVEQDGTKVQVRVQASQPIRPTTLYLKNPARIVLDFPLARWADGLQIPEAAGEVRKVRIGHPVPNQARLVLDLNSDALKVTGLTVDSGNVAATISAGTAIANLPPTRVLTAEDARLRRILEIRQKGNGRKVTTTLNSRGEKFSIPGSERLDPSSNPENPLEPVQPRVVDGASLAGKVICVDAGHGGHSAGAKGLDNLEKDLCLKMAIAFRDALQARGATVIMPRDSDVYVGLDERCAYANSRSADLFISIHCNSMPRRNMQSGSESYWHTPQSVGLAQALHPHLVRAVLGRDGGIRNRSFAVIRETKMPSVLLEIAYINNTTDEQLLANPAFHLRLADELAEGVVEYMNK